MPVPDGIDLQDQYSPLGQYARWIHDAVLLPIITIISLFVLVLLLWVIVRFNRRANPVAVEDQPQHRDRSGLDAGPGADPGRVLPFPRSTCWPSSSSRPPADALTIKVDRQPVVSGPIPIPTTAASKLSPTCSRRGRSVVKPGERFRTDADGPASLLPTTAWSCLRASRSACRSPLPT